MFVFFLVCVFVFSVLADVALVAFFVKVVALKKISSIFGNLPNHSEISDFFRKQYLSEYSERPHSEQS